MPKSTIPQTDVNGVVNIPNIDFDELTAASPTDTPKLSVVKDYGLDDLLAGPESETEAEADRGAKEIEYDRVVIEKPRKLDPVYVHPTWRCEVYLLLPSGSMRRFTHLVHRKVARQFSRICGRYLLVPYSGRKNKLGIWPISLEDATGNMNRYSQEAIKLTRDGGGKWVNYEADMVAETYRAFVEDEQDPPPQWPESLEQMIKTAFDGCVITSPDHELLKRRMGKPLQTSQS